LQAVTPEVLVGLMAEPERLRVVATLVLGARTTADIAAASGLDPRSVGKALRRLEAGGMVESGADGLVLREELFKQAAAGRPHVRGDENVEPALRPFLRNGRLLRFPAQPAKRRAVLEHVARSFEPGVRHPEREVDSVLRKWCEGGEADHAALRRYLVDEDFLSRGEGQYWRSGGHVDLG
jgi:hypothetical protein